MKAFDLNASDLDGIHLIEASAGTGKTYTIAGLFVRLIIEQALKVEEILVVTFTKAATDELKDRIRQNLSRAKIAFELNTSDDPFLKEMLLKTPDHKKAITLLYQAITEFDKAPIFTIHGFCQRILMDNAFETRILFDSEVISDQSEYLKLVAQDYFRNHLYDAPMEYLRYVSKKWPDPSHLIGFLQSLTSYDIRVIPEIEVEDETITGLEMFRAAYEDLRTEWLIVKEDLKGLLSSPDLNGTSYGGLKSKTGDPLDAPRFVRLNKLYRSMDIYLLGQAIGYPAFDGFEKLTTEYITSKTKKNKTAPSHSFFDRCNEFYKLYDDLVRQMDRCFLQLKAKSVRFCDEKLKELKQRANVLYFDDLLYYVDQALSSKGKDHLISLLQKQYRAALVDEFQDTDSIQYKIFSMLFPEGSHTLFMIGDPKQAIYGFRGADVFSYLKAVKRTHNQHTLTHNWRSSPRLIKAVNTLFLDHPIPFVFDDIAYLETISAKDDETGADKGAPIPMIIWYLTSEDLEIKKLSKSLSEELIYSAVSNEIARLINESDDPARPSDIAILVRTNGQAQNFKQHLSERQIPSVLYSTGSVIATHEAIEIYRILSAIAQPSDEALVKSALSTDMMGKTAQDLFSDEKHDSVMEAYYYTFQHYHDLWHKDSFISMFRELMLKEGVKARLLSFFDGERRLTNVLHLLELLHQAAMENDLGMRGMIKWFGEKRTQDSFDGDSQQIRLESDRYAVKIITIHKSKGLEYNIVFCPFLWAGGMKKGDEIFFHDKEKDLDLTVSLDPDSNPEQLEQSRKEQLAEEMRILYVALTRAKYASYVVFAHVQQKPLSALSYLVFESFLRTNEGEAFQNLDQLASLLSNMNRETIVERLKSLETKGEGTIRIFPMPRVEKMSIPKGADVKNEIVYRPFKSKIKTHWSVSSFSSILEGAHKGPFDLSLMRDSEKDVLDGFFYGPGQPVSTLSDGNNESVFTFPKGARAGTFFHELFENLDYTSQNDEYCLNLIRSKLKEHGFEARFETVIFNTVQHILNTPYLAGEETILLSNVQVDHRITEMGFYYPLKIDDPLDTLMTLFERFGKKELIEMMRRELKYLFLSASKGFMKGFIDLIFQYNGKFYLLDWKSNFLGGEMEDYSHDRIIDVMEKEAYVLQYHIYALALHLYLRNRWPLYSYDSCFGGIFYLFLRGIRKDRKDHSGVFFDRPEKGLIEGLEKILLPHYEFQEKF